MGLLTAVPRGVGMLLGLLSGGAVWVSPWLSWSVHGSIAVDRFQCSSTFAYADMIPAFEHHETFTVKSRYAHI